MDFARVIRDRRSVRHYDARRIEDAVVAQIIEEAAWAPSAGNIQPWKLAILSDDPLRRFLARFESDALDLVLPGAKEALFEVSARTGLCLETGSLNRIVTEAAARHRLSEAPPSHLLIVYYERPGLVGSLRTIRLSASLTWFCLRRRAGAQSKMRYLWLMLSRWRQLLAASHRVRLASVCNYVYALTLCAHNRGIDSCIIAAFNPTARAVQRFVGLRARDEIVAVVALGHRRSDDAAATADRGRWEVSARWLAASHRDGDPT
jgi:nitroreductase